MRFVYSGMLEQLLINIFCFTWMTIVSSGNNFSNGVAGLAVYMTFLFVKVWFLLEPFHELTHHCWLQEWILIRFIEFTADAVIQGVNAHRDDCIYKTE